MSAISAARADWAGYSTGAPTLAYGDYRARLARYAQARAYFANLQYDELSASAAALRTSEKLYRFIRSVINPVQLQNDLLSAYVYRGTLDTDTLTGGSLPLVFDNPALEPALKACLLWSNLDQQLGKYVSDVSLLGDGFWYVIDDPQRRRVRLDLLDPAYVRYIERDAVGNIKAVVIEYEYSDPPEIERYQPGRYGGLDWQPAKTHIKTVVIDKASFRTFRDSKPFDYQSDTEDGPMSAWDNDLGFVPLKSAYFAEGDGGWGRNSFNGIARRQIDELNDQASIINDAIRRVVAKPLLKARGIASAAQIDVKSDERDSMSIVYISNAEGDIEPLTIPLDISAAAANRDSMLRQLESNMPELTLARVRDIGGNLSGTAIENMFGDAISRIKQVRKNVDPPLVAALQMAVTIGGVRGYDGFSAFDAESFDRGEMTLSVADRPVIDDSLSRQDRIAALATVSAMPPSIARLTLKELGYSDREIEAVVIDLQAASQTQPPALLGQPDSTPEFVPAELQQRLTAALEAGDGAV